MHEFSDGWVPTSTLPRRIRDRSKSAPTAVALRGKEFGIWDETTWSDYWEQSTLVGHALLELGVEAGQTVAIHSDNRREWLFCDIGIIAIRAITVGIYPTNPAAELLHILRDSAATVLIAEDQEQVDKALQIADELPGLRRIVYIDPRGLQGRYVDDRLMAWEDFLSLGRRHRTANAAAVEELVEAAEGDDVATLVYTSGTTGPPKGAKLTISNIEYVMDVLAAGGFANPAPDSSDLLVSYLPLCHVAERLFTVWMQAAAGNQVCFAESVETVQQALREVQPTIVCGVPRIWEKALTSVHIRVSGSTRLKRMNFALWMKVGSWLGAELVANRGKYTWKTRAVYGVGWVFLYRSLRSHLGFSKTRFALSGAAPIAPEFLVFFMGIGVPMHEAYGMTENSAMASTNKPGRILVGTVGEPQLGVEIQLDPDSGEILTRSPANFAGYWRDEEATARTMTADGWLRTGDVGVWTDETYLKITDRIKDILITAGGKNISPSEIENNLKVSPYVKEAIVVGDGRKYLTALIGIELETVGEWAQKQKIQYTTYRDLTERPEVRQLVQTIVNGTNTKFASVETIKKFTLLSKELDHEDGELTATQKVKRSAIAAMFESEIERMYSREDGVGQ